MFFHQAEPVLEDFPAWSDEYAATMAQVWKITENAGFWQYRLQMERDYDTPEGKERADDDAYMMPMEQRDPMMWNAKIRWTIEY